MNPRKWRIAYWSSLYFHFLEFEFADSLQEAAQLAISKYWLPIESIQFAELVNGKYVEAVGGVSYA